MKLLYLSTWDFSHAKTDGVCKKIETQITVFEKKGFQVDFIFIEGNKVLFREDGVVREIARVGSIKKTPAYMKMYKFLKHKKYDWVYNRFGMMDTFYYRVLKKLRANGAKILMEIPTYPYVGEKPKGLLYKFMFWWDEIYWGKLKNVVERIVIYGQEKEIWNIPTLCIMNGIDLSKVKIVDSGEKDDVIDLLFVALMQPHHGYERVLYGLKQYYDLGGTRKIFCHFVGDGPEKEYYEKIVSENGLDSRVAFYGRQGGEALDEIYRKADIGMCVFGGYKQGQFWCSDLKSKEYMAKGLPVVTGVETDILDLIDKRYFRQFANDESTIDMNEVVAFYDELYGKNLASDVSKSVRKEVEPYVDMEATMRPVLEFQCFPD